MNIFTDSLLKGSNHGECARDKPCDRTATCISKVLRLDSMVCAKAFVDVCGGCFCLAVFCYLARKHLI